MSDERWVSVRLSGEEYDLVFEAVRFEMLSSVGEDRKRLERVARQVYRCMVASAESNHRREREGQLSVRGSDPSHVRGLSAESAPLRRRKEA